jgi:hypothetical protein
VREILGRRVEGFTTRHDVNINEVEYVDKNQAKQHEEAVKKRQVKFDEKQKAAEESKLFKKQSDERKKASTNVKKRHKKEIDWEEWDELASEIREMKRARKQKNKGK